jgi:hypothetical protein
LRSAPARWCERARRRAAERKELYIVPNAGHVDLCDKTDLIPPASSGAAGELVGYKS